MKLAVIIPTYDNLEMLKPMVSNLKGFNIYVVEDGVRQETVRWLKTQKVKTILHDENKGVAISWNDGIKEAIKNRCTHFAIINDDVVLPKDWWDKCKEIFSNDVHLVSMETKCLMSGWFFIIDKTCIDKIGYFDETIGLYGGEDDDYIRRYRSTRLKRAYVDIDLWHYGSKTINKLNPIEVAEVRSASILNLKNKYPRKTIRV